MTDEDKKDQTDESQGESQVVPAPGAEVTQEMRDVTVDLEDMRTLSTGASVLKGALRLKPAEDVLEAKRNRDRMPFSDRELTPLQRWEEMGRIAKAIEHACVNGNMVGIQHAAQEIAFYWRELEKQRSNTACDLVFQTPSQAFEDGMAELLGAEDAEEMAPKLKEEPSSDMLQSGQEYTCPQCQGLREIPGVSVYGKVEGLYLASRNEFLEFDELVCPSCGFVVAVHYPSRLYWEKSNYQPDVDQLAGDSVEHHLWARIESLEAHIKAVEASIPAMISQAIADHEAAMGMAKNTADDADEETLWDLEKRLKEEKTDE